MRIPEQWFNELEDLTQPIKGDSVMKYRVEMKCWDGNRSWTETQTFSATSWYDLDDQVYNHLDWTNGFVVEDYKVLEETA